MRRTFIMACIAVLGFFTTPSQGFAAVLKDVDAPTGTPRTGVLIVAPSVFIVTTAATEFGPLVVTADAEAQRMADAFRAQPGVHYVEVLSGTTATMSGVTTAITRLTEEHLEYVIFSYRGLGLNADAPPPCFVLADWDPGSPDGSCLSAVTVAELLAKAAPHRLALLDATRATPSLLRTMGYEAWGPSADDWPNAMPAVSVGKSREAVDCPVFSPMITKVIGAVEPHEGLTMGMLTTRLTAEATEVSRERCGSMTLHVTFGGQYSPLDAVIPPVALAAMATTTPLPAKPHPSATWKRDGKASTATVATAIASGVLAAGAGGVTAYGYTQLANYNDRDWVNAEGYTSAARQTAADAELPVYGWTALTLTTLAAAGLTVTVATW